MKEKQLQQKKSLRNWIRSNTLKAVIGVLTISSLCSSEAHSQAPFWVFQEDFTGNPGPSVNNQIITEKATYTSNLPTADDGSTVASAGINGTGNSELRITPRGGAAGIGYIMGSTANFNERYKARLDENEDIVTWHVGMLHSRSGQLSTSFAAGSHASAVILACDKADPTAVDAKGYALFLIRLTTNTRAIMLRYFDAGINSVSNTAADRIAYSNNISDASNIYFRVKVTYDPADNTWTLATTNTSSFGDPVTNTYTTRTTGQAGPAHTVGTGISMPYFGFAHCWQNESTNSNHGRYDNFYVSVGEEGTQPVNLTSFTAQKSLTGVQLNWQTASEQDNSHFEIQRSANGVDFSAIDVVAGKGTTAEINNYSYVDANPLAGTAYYRLKQVDFNGNSELSTVVSVNSSLSEENLKAYVSASGNIVVSYVAASESFATVEILDVSGRKVAGQTVKLQKGDNQINVPVNLANGVYVARLTNGGTQAAVKFLK